MNIEKAAKPSAKQEAKAAQTKPSFKHLERSKEQTRRDDEESLYDEAAKVSREHEKSQKPTKEEPQEVKDRRKRRAVTEIDPKTVKGLHPFGIRNAALCAAREFMRTGKRAEADRKIAEAAQIAPLSRLENNAINRAMRTAWPTPARPKAHN